MSKIKRAERKSWARIKRESTMSVEVSNPSHNWPKHGIKNISRFCEYALLNVSTVYDEMKKAENRFEHTCEVDGYVFEWKYLDDFLVDMESCGLMVAQRIKLSIVGINVDSNKKADKELWASIQNYTNNYSGVQK